jgi:hypothetical protein
MMALAPRASKRVTRDVPGGSRARIVLAVDHEHVAGLHLLDALPLQVVHVRLGGHRAVGINALARRDKAHRKSAPGERFDMLVQRAQTHQRRLPVTVLEELRGERAAADFRQLRERIVAHHHVARRDGGK